MRLGHTFDRRRMRRVLLVVPLCLAALLVAAVGPRGALAAGWTPLCYSDEVDLNGVACADAAHLWAVGDPGVIFHSENGGLSWTGQAPIAGVGYFAVACADPTHVWAVGGTVVATTDGGATWTRQEAANGMGLYGVACADTADAWAVGQYGTILHTTDGGTTWTAQTSGTTDHLFGVTCTDADHAWTVGQNGTVLVTTDGGTTWTPLTSGTTQNLTAVAHADADHLWAVGAHGTVVVTIDGGAHWSPQDSGTTDILEAVACPDASHAWVGGWPLDDGKPTLLHTTDGGGTWAALNGWLDAGVYGIACADATHAWAVGTNGIVLAWDTVGPVTRAAATGGRRGRTIMLHYMVTDKLSVVAMAVRVVVRNSRGKAVRSFSLGARKVACWQRVSWIPTTRGTYRYYVYAKDLAGNKQSKHGLAKVVVR